MAVRSRRENHLLHVGARQQRMRLTQDCQVPECTEFTLATIFLSLRNSTPFKSAHQNPIHQGERTGKSSDKLQQVNICIWQSCATSEMVFGKSDKGGKTAMRSFPSDDDFFLLLYSVVLNCRPVLIIIAKTTQPESLSSLEATANAFSAHAETRFCRKERENAKIDRIRKISR